MTDAHRKDDLHAVAEGLLRSRPAGTGIVILAEIVVAAVLFLGFYLLRPLWSAWPRFHEMVFERGLWPHGIVLLGSLVMAALLLRVLGVIRGRFDPSVLQLPEHGELTDEQLAQAGQRLATSTEGRGRRRAAPWVRRLAVALLEFARGESKESVRDTLRAHAELDAESLGSRYTLVKLYLWAIPLLGFIGTVEGIGSGIGEFSLQLESQTVLEAEAPAGQALDETGGASEGTAAVRESLQAVTEGLGRAFDTTYLALAVAVFLMIAISAVEKLEADRLLALDEYCQAQLVPRLPSTNQDIAAVASGVEVSLRHALEVAAQVRAVTESLESFFSSLQAGVECRVKLEQPSDRGGAPEP